MIKCDDHTVEIKGNLSEVLCNVTCLVETIIECSARNGLNPTVIELAVNEAVIDGRSRFRKNWHQSEPVRIGHETYPLNLNLKKSTYSDTPKKLKESL